MKYLAFIIMFVPLSALVGLLVGLSLQSVGAGFVGAGLTLGLSIDLCFNGSEE